MRSKFYLAYPDETATNAPESMRRGFHSNLRYCVAVAFYNNDQAATSALTSSDEANSIFYWPPNVLDTIAGIKFAGCDTLIQKQLHVVAYLLELVYDLMISPRDNVSRSPGFETCIGVFGNTE